MHVCICAHTQTHTHKHTCIHPSIHTYLLTYIRSTTEEPHARFCGTLVVTYIHAYIHTYISAYKHQVHEGGTICTVLWDSGRQDNTEVATGAGNRYMLVGLCMYAIQRLVQDLETYICWCMYVYMVVRITPRLLQELETDICW